VDGTVIVFVLIMDGQMLHHHIQLNLPVAIRMLLAVPVLLHFILSDRVIVVQFVAKTTLSW
jgi:hypothetical protein